MTAPKPIAIDDLLEHTLPVSLTASPSGHAVWCERSLREKAPRKPVAHLVVASPSLPVRVLTKPGDRVDSSPAISPDERWVAFVRKANSSAQKSEAEQKEISATELCLVPIEGGDVSVLARQRGSFSSLAWHPTSNRIAFSFRRDDVLPKGYTAPLSIRVDRAFYKLDGLGFFPVDRNRIYVVSLDAAPDRGLEPIPLGDRGGAWDDTDPVFSPDGSQLAFLSNRRPGADLNAENRDLFVAPAGGGDVRCCTEEEGVLMQPVWAPNGTWIAALGSFGGPGTMLTKVHVGLVSIDPSGTRAEQMLSSHIDASLMNLAIDDLWGLDEWAIRPVFALSGARLLAPLSARGTTLIAAMSVDANGQTLGEPVTVLDAQVITFAGGDVLCAVTTSPDDPGAVIRFDATGGTVLNPNSDAVEELAAPLREFVSSRFVAKPTELDVTTDDGARIQGWIYLPADEGPHPLLLNIHGGPCVQFGTGFFNEVQTFVSAGYAVLQLNPRGSQGYGLEFCKAINRDWGRKPHIDLMAGLDAAIERFPIDSNRLGVMGGSYGGYMTNWIIAHTDRFSAACTQRTVSQMEALIWSDFGAGWGGEIGSWPWDDREHYIDQSPISYAKNINTPVLILQGLNDQRTPADQGERMFVTLRVLGKEVEMVLFPGADHGLSRSGGAEQRVERLRVIHEWFDRKLKA